jgi:hypothetical protein
MVRSSKNSWFYLTGKCFELQHGNTHQHFGLFFFLVERLKADFKKIIIKRF